MDCGGLGETLPMGCDPPNKSGGDVVPTRGGFLS